MFDNERNHSQINGLEESHQTINVRNQDDESATYDYLKEQIEQNMNMDIMRQNLQSQKFKVIGDMIYSQKTKTVISIGLVALAISSYFIACYFLAVESFSQTPEIIRYLDLIFFKDACLENAMAFVRENQILNDTITLIEDNQTTAANYFI